MINALAADNPYLTTGRISSCWIAQNNWVSGARHVLKLVDGTLGNLPVRPDLASPNWGGFTVGSENPVYVYGDYNSNPADTIWGGGADQPHASAGIIADAVIMLSNSWSDLASLNSPSNDGGRVATTSYYRTAIASGKNINFSVAGIGWAVGDFGTDGGLHNFLRLVENWGGQTLNYDGSMVSMYYSTYATGTDKNGGGTVYEPPKTKLYLRCRFHPAAELAAGHAHVPRYQQPQLPAELLPLRQRSQRSLHQLAPAWPSTRSESRFPGSGQMRDGGFLCAARLA